MTNDKDIMTLLPSEASSTILSFLDARSLLACSLVNEDWDEITNNLLPEVWFQACLDADILVKRDKYINTKDWKAFLFPMIQRRFDMKSSKFFEIGSVPVRTPITAIYCHNGKIALAFLGKIEIWQVPGNLLYREFQCDFETTFLKFDDNILLSGSTDGLVRLWSMPAGAFLRTYNSIGEITTSFDFLSDYDIFVKSFMKKRLFLTGLRLHSIWDQAGEKQLFLQPQSLVVRVMLAPHPGYPLTEELKKCYLFCLTMHYINVCELTSKYPDFLYRIVLTHKHDISFEERHSTGLIYKPPGGLLFDGTDLYVMTPSVVASNLGILRWNLIRNVLIRIRDNQISSLLGVGQMYLAYEIETGNDVERIHIMHKISHEVVAVINLPWKDELKDDYLCLYETSWLDGLNGENDSGIIGAFIAEDLLSVKYIKFLPRRQ